MNVKVVLGILYCHQNLIIFFQERKLLLKKIGTLNERVAEVNLRKSMSPSRKTIEKNDAAIQVNLWCNVLIKNWGSSIKLRFVFLEFQNFSMKREIKAHQKLCQPIFSVSWWKSFLFI